MPPKTTKAPVKTTKPAAKTIKTPAKTTKVPVKPAAKTTKVPVKPATKTTKVPVKPAAKTTKVPAKTPTPTKRLPAQLYEPKISPPRKILIKVAKASEKRPPPKGWSLDCWNLFQDKRSKLREGEVLEMKGYYVSSKEDKTKGKRKSNISMADLTVDKTYRIGATKVDLYKLEEPLKWLRKWEK